MVILLRILVVFSLFLLLRDGITIMYGDLEILYISGSMFRYCLWCDFLFYLFEYLVPWLYEKLNLSLKQINNILDSKLDKKC